MAEDWRQIPDGRWWNVNTGEIEATPESRPNPHFDYQSMYDKLEQYGYGLIINWGKKFIYPKDRFGTVRSFGPPDEAALKADPIFQRLTSATGPDGGWEFATPEDASVMFDSSSPENNQGGSDFANIMKVLGTVAGGYSAFGPSGLFTGAGSLGADTAAFEAGGAGGLQNWGNLGADTAAFEAGGAAGLQDWGTLGGNAFGGDYMSLDGALPGAGAPVSEMGSIYNPASQTFTSNLGNQVAGMTGSGMLGNLGSAASGAGSLLGGGGSLLGALGTGMAGLYGANVAADQTQAYRDMAAQYAGYGAPYRQRLSDLYANPSGFLQSQEVQKPVQMGSDIMARSLSTQGNPVGSGNALQQLQSYSADQLFGRLGQEKDRLGGFGGLSGYNQAAPQAQQAAIQSMSNAPNVIGATASSIFNPQPTLAQTMAQFRTLSGG